MKNNTVKKLKLMYCGINFWSHLTFKDPNGSYFVSFTDKAWGELNDSEREGVLNNLMYCGNDPDNDPVSHISGYNIVLADSF